MIYRNFTNIYIKKSWYKIKDSTRLVDRTKWTVHGRIRRSYDTRTLFSTSLPDPTRLPDKTDAFNTHWSVNPETRLRVTQDQRTGGNGEYMKREGERGISSHTGTHALSSTFLHDPTLLPDKPDDSNTQGSVNRHTTEQRNENTRPMKQRTANTRAIRQE